MSSKKKRWQEKKKGRREEQARVRLIMTMQNDECGVKISWEAHQAPSVNNGSVKDFQRPRTTSFWNRKYKKIHSLQSKEKYFAELEDTVPVVAKKTLFKILTCFISSFSGCIWSYLPWDMHFKHSLLRWRPPYMLLRLESDMRFRCNRPS